MSDQSAVGAYQKQNSIQELRGRGVVKRLTKDFDPHIVKHLAPCQEASTFDIDCEQSPADAQCSSPSCKYQKQSSIQELRGRGVVKRRTKDLDHHIVKDPAKENDRCQEATTSDIDCERSPASHCSSPNGKYEKQMSQTTQSLRDRELVRKVSRSFEERRKTEAFGAASRDLQGIEDAALSDAVVDTGSPGYEKQHSLQALRGRELVKRRLPDGGKVHSRPKAGCSVFSLGEAPAASAAAEDIVWVVDVAPAPGDGRSATHVVANEEAPAVKSFGAEGRTLEGKPQANENAKDANNAFLRVDNSAKVSKQRQRQRSVGRADDCTQKEKLLLAQRSDCFPCLSPCFTGLWLLKLHRKTTDAALCQLDAPAS